jgi:signal peptidase I
MFDKWRKYSYVAQKERRHNVLKVVFWVLVSFAGFSLLGSMFVFTAVVENGSMEPGIRRGDRFVASPLPFGVRLPALSVRIPGPATPARGDLVVIEKSPGGASQFNRFVNSLVLFFSAQRVSLGSRTAASYLLKRVVGVPGDTLTMADHILRVKPAGDSYGLTEFELTTHPYDIAVPKLPEGWTAGFPFSGSMDDVVLGPGEFFVMSDDRSGANDSRVWGSVSFDAIVGKVLFRYWPLSRFGRP